MMKIKPVRVFSLVILIFLLIKSFFLSMNVWWDPAVYIGMGKYIFSFGKSGLWEISRPLIWPLMLGFLWRLGLNAVIFGKILSVLMTIGCAYLIFLIGKEVFDEKVALLASLFFVFSPAVFFNSELMLTGIPSTFFGLLAVYYMLRKRYFLVGIFSGIAFMTRFLQLIMLAGFGTILLIYYKKLKIKPKDFCLLGLGFAVPVIPYLILNLFLYGRAFYPFIVQLTLTKYTGWMWWEPLSFYFMNLFKENFLIVFAAVGVSLTFWKRNYRKSLVFSLFLLFFVFYNLQIHKEMRFAVTFFPYLYLLTAFGLIRFFDFIKKERELVKVLVIVFVFLFCFRTYFQYEREPRIEHFQPFYDYVGEAEGTLWITNPVFIVYSDKKADELIYYSTSGVERFGQLTPKIDAADNILINTCDIPCPPWNEFCVERKDAFMGAVNLGFKKVHEDNFWDCELYIFKK